MENRGLLFIPDISGFTRFVNETEIGHSRLIIQELLEILINANETGLEISEIEGDAILFYKFGGIPDLEALYKQVEKMFCEFHRHLVAYDRHRFCQCKACVSAVDLTLKVITHYGEFAGYNVKNFNKLIGKDIIVAHQLLKNDIQQHEYWLVTNSLVQDHALSGYAQWMEWDSSVKQTENGEIPFHYTQLSRLKDQIGPDESLQPVPAEKAAMITLRREYATDIITLFHATGDFNYRHRWLDGVKAVEQVSHFLPRVGMKCRCTLENGEAMVYSSSYSYQENRIEFSETDEKGSATMYYVLEAMGDSRTRLTLTYYLKRNWIRQVLFSLQRKKKMEESLRKSLMNLDALVKEIKI